MRWRGPSGVLLTLAAALATAPAAATDPTDGESFFERSVLPLLEANCFECHSHAADVTEGGLALDLRSGWEKGGESGPALRRIWGGISGNLRAELDRTTLESLIAERDEGMFYI